MFDRDIPRLPKADIHLGGCFATGTQTHGMKIIYSSNETAQKRLTLISGHLTDGTHFG